MQCPNCHHLIDAGAAFCGNCGQPVAVAAPVASSPIAAGYANAAIQPAVPLVTNVAAMPAAMAPHPGVPAYAAPTPSHHTKGILSIVFGSISIVFCLIPLISIVLGITGVILGTLSPKQAGKGIKITGIILSSVGILFGLAAWGIFIAASPEIKQMQAENNKTSQTQPVASGSTTTTPATAASTLVVDNGCYSISLSKSMTVNKSSTGCDAQMYTGGSATNPAEAFTVMSVNEPSITTANFGDIKDAITDEMAQVMPGYTITAQRSGTFKGSPAFYVDLSKDGSSLSAEEATVLHTSPQGDNIFIIAHAANGSSTNLSGLEAGWTWK